MRATLTTNIFGTLDYGDGGPDLGRREAPAQPVDHQRATGCLEEQLGHQLFDRRHRRLALTERGALVKSYADDIFTLGEEPVDVVHAVGTGRHSYHMHIGIGHNLPKLLAYQLVSPAIHIDDFPVHLVIEEDDPERLVGHIATHHLDLVLSDQPVGLTAEVRANCQMLMQTGISLYGAPELVRSLRDDFRRRSMAPRSCPGAIRMRRRSRGGCLRAICTRGSSSSRQPVELLGKEGAGVLQAA